MEVSQSNIFNQVRPPSRQPNNLEMETRGLGVIFGNSVNKNAEYQGQIVQSLSDKQKVINQSFQNSSDMIMNSYQTAASNTQALSQQILDQLNLNAGENESDRFFNNSSRAGHQLINMNMEVARRAVEMNEQQKNHAIVALNEQIDKAVKNADLDWKRDQQKITVALNAITELQNLKRLEIQQYFDNQEKEKQTTHNNNMIVLREKHANAMEIQAAEQKYEQEVKKAQSYQKDKEKCINDFFKRLREVTETCTKSGNSYQITRTDPIFDDANQRIIERGSVDYKTGSGWGFFRQFWYR